MARGAAAPARRTRPSGADVQHAPVRRPAKRRTSGPASGHPRKTGASAAPATKPKPRKTGSTRKAAAARNGAAAPARKAPARKAPARKRRALRPAPAGAPLAIRVARAPFFISLRQRGSGILDSLLAGQGWIVLVGALLVGVVFFNVGLLELNRGITHTADKVTNLKRENAGLRSEVAKLGSSERIQSAAAAEGLVLPKPGDVRYLSIDPKLDARRAARRITAPNSVALVTPPPAPVEPTLTTPPSETTTTPPATTEPQATTDSTAPTTTTAPPVTPAPETTSTGTPTG